MAQSKENGHLHTIEDKLRRMREELDERKQRLLHRLEQRDAGSTTKAAAQDVETAIVRVRRPPVSGLPETGDAGSASHAALPAVRPLRLEREASDSVEVGSAAGLTSGSPPEAPSKGVPAARAQEVQSPESRWLNAAHRAWKSQVAELLRDREAVDQERRKLQAGLDAAHQAWKSQTAELLQRVSEAEAKSTERERWLEAAHRAWKSQTSELLARVRAAEARRRPSPTADEGRAAEEASELRRKLHEEQLRHVQELEAVHDAYIKRAEAVEATHTRVLGKLRHEYAQALGQLSDAKRGAALLNDRIQQMEGERFASPPAPVESRSGPEGAVSPSKRKRFVDAADAVTTVIAPESFRPTKHRS